MRAALHRAARSDEDLIFSRDLASDALAFGYPRVIVCIGCRREMRGVVGIREDVPVLDVSRERLRIWEEVRRSAEIPPRRITFIARRLEAAIHEVALESTWVDRALADLTRLAGVSLPPALRTFGRRIMEFPSHYNDLHPLAASVGLSRGALKARFRRRRLESPYTYQRWFRMMAAAHVLADRSVTVAAAAERLGFTSDGNLCRALRTLSGLTPSEVRTVKGWNRLLVSFAWNHLGPDRLDGWWEIEDLFPARFG